MPQIVELLHGRKAHIFPMLWTDDLVWVVFGGEGPLPDYDIYGWEEDVSLGEFIQKHTLNLDANGAPEYLPMTPVADVIKNKISPDFRQAADALCWREREASKKTVTRERGALYLLNDKATGKWSVWLEAWPNFFSRSHVSKSKERQTRDSQELQTQFAAQYATRESKRLADQKAELSKPSTKVVLLAAVALGFWGLYRLIFA